MSMNKTVPTRRKFIAGATLAPIALNPVAVNAEPVGIVALIDMLEAGQGWERASTVWAKSWVASELRKLHGLPSQEGQTANNTQHHIHNTQRDFEDHLSHEKYIAELKLGAA